MATTHDISSASAAWMEHQILEHVKQALRVTLEWDAPEVSMPRKLSSVRFTLKSFRRHLERLMAIEEENGYLSVVAESKPNLQTQIDRLAHDHERFRARMREIVPAAEDLTDWQEQPFDEICHQIGDLLDEIDEHDLHEITLIQDSLLYDEGGEG